MKLLPLILACAGAIAGLGAGHLLAPTVPGEKDGKQGHHVSDHPTEAGAHETAVPEHAEFAEPADDDVDYVRLNNQFIVPIVEGERVASLIVISLALETDTGATDIVYEREPKLRDAFLDDLFAHARSGGFTGSFTDAHLMTDLRRSLLESARQVLGDSVRSVLLNEIVRQDLS